LSFLHRTTPEIGIDEFEALRRDGNVSVLDVREEWEYRRGRVPDALNVPLSQLQLRIADVPRDKRVLVICESGSRSLAAADFLLRSGFAGAVSVRGGTSAWARANGPLERDQP
jgi:rhodanese-related sulfurtransferase